MKKYIKIILILFSLMIILIGCQKKIIVTTFDEVIENNAVEIDGIEYYIQLVEETSYKYDGDNNLIKTIMNKIDINVEKNTKFKYKNNILIEKIIEYKKSSDVLGTFFYYYNYEGRLINSESVVGSEENSTVDYQYNGQTTKVIFKDEDGSITGYIEEILDNDDNVLISTSYDVDGTSYFTKNNYYEDNKLIQSIYEYSYGNNSSHYYEYNNIGDIIFSYSIQDKDDPLMTVKFFEYEYNKNYLPVTMKLYQVEAPIIKEKIRGYWE